LFPEYINELQKQYSYIKQVNYKDKKVVAQERNIDRLRDKVK